MTAAAEGKLNHSAQDSQMREMLPIITVASSFRTEKHSSFCTCSVRVVGEMGSEKKARTADLKRIVQPYLPPKWVVQL